MEPMNPSSAGAPLSSEDNRAWPPAMRWMLNRRLLPGIVLALAASFLIAGWSPGFPMVYTVLRSLGLWLLNGVLLGCLYCLAAHWLARQPWMPSAWVALGAGGAVAVLGYLSFWVWFAHPIAGLAFSIGALASAIRLLVRKRLRFDARDREWISVSVAMVFIGLFHLGILHLFGSRLGFFDLAHQRFIENMGGDNVLPYGLNYLIGKGNCPAVLAEGWLTSDRPPLQTGWQTLTWPLASVLHLSDKYVAGLAGVWFQLLWVAAAHGLLRWLGLGTNRALAWCAVLSLNGFFLLNTVFTWPKLGGGAFACGAFALWAMPPSPHRRVRMLAGAVLAALAWLSHGGVVFSLLPLAPWVAWRALRGEMRLWLAAGAVFAAFALPWAAFQKFHAPPANRLLKWHLGGQIEIDPRGTWETIRDAYAAKSWDEIVAIKMLNLKLQFDGHWHQLTDLSAGRAQERRTQEFCYAGIALTWWKIAPAFLLLALATPAGRRQIAECHRRCSALAAWIGATLIVWCLLIFLPGATYIHHGSYAMMIGLFVILSFVIDAAGSWAIIVLAALQTIGFLTTWAVASPAVSGPLSPPALLLGMLGAAGLARLISHAADGDEHSTAETS